MYLEGCAHILNDNIDELLDDHEHKKGRILYFGDSYLGDCYGAH